MRRIKLTIAYDGTEYSGWQVQENAETVQGVVSEALGELLRDCGDEQAMTEEGVELIGASRTDAGVHAEGNVAVFDTTARMPAEKFAYALNARLPEDIRVLQSGEVSDNFHPRYTDSHKTYVYQILNAPIAIPTLTRYMHHIYEDLDINLMLDAEELFIGEHDFSAFCSAGAQVKSKVRTIESLRVTEERLDVAVGASDGQPDVVAGPGGSNPVPEDGRSSLTIPGKSGKIIRIEVTGTGFLYNMVRIIAGTLIEVGLARRTLDTVKRAIEEGDRTLAGPTAPAKGLTLKQITYD
ncbi:MAG: tRNA pseudouridine(38-40) synthase TruA [Eubacterium sp.]|nr:tRNA pseudouridine(38-40) synthase TruA [Eubacterium sp.]